MIEEQANGDLVMYMTRGWEPTDKYHAELIRRIAKSGRTSVERVSSRPKPLAGGPRPRGLRKVTRA